MSVGTVTEETFAAEVLGADQPVLVEFWAQWCGPCHQLAPVIEQIAADRADSLRVVKVNADENPVIAAQYRVLGLPTLLVFENGEPIAQLTGARPRTAVERELDKVLA